MSQGIQGVALTLLDAVGATGASKEFTPSTYKVNFQIIISATATCTIQGSLDGTNWTTVGTAATATGWVLADAPYKYLRANVTAFTSGTVTCKAFY